MADHFGSMGTTQGDRIHIYVGSAPRDPVDWLRAQIVERKAVAAIVDPLFRFLPRIEDGNSYAELTAATGPLIGLARSTGCALILTHHARKGWRRTR